MPAPRQDNKKRNKQGAITKRLCNDCQLWLTPTYYYNINNNCYCIECWKRRNTIITRDRYKSDPVFRATRLAGSKQYMKNKYHTDAKWRAHISAYNKARYLLKKKKKEQSCT